MKVTVFGAGTMGNGIAQVFASNGNEVTLIDISQEAVKKARSTMEASLKKLKEKGMINGEPEKIIETIKFSVNLDDCKDSELIIEAVFERIDVKKDILQKISQSMRNGTILASNTSSISISQLASFVKDQERFIGMHFFNPPPLMKLIEIVRGNRTSEDTAKKVFEISKEIGKEPVIVHDYPGFVSNRILMPMLREAIVVLEQGIASKEDIDRTMKLGMNHPMGPLTLCDYVGNDVVLDVMEVMYREFGDPHYKAPILLKNMVYAGKLGRKSGEGFYKY